jgi:hypothetical protein
MRCGVSVQTVQSSWPLYTGVYFLMNILGESIVRFARDFNDVVNYWHDNYQWQYKQYSVKKLNFYYVNLQIGESLVMAVEIWIFRKIIKTPGMEQKMFSMPGVSAFIWYDWMIDEHFALHARSFVNFTLHARSLFEKTLTHLNWPWVQRSTRLYSLYRNSYNDLSSLARKALQFHFWSSTAVPTFTTVFIGNIPTFSF